MIMPPRRPSRLRAYSRRSGKVIARNGASTVVDIDQERGTGSLYLDLLPLPLKLTQTCASRIIKAIYYNMRSVPSCLAALGVLVQFVPEASAHGFVNLIKTGGKFYPGWDLNYYYQSNPPAVAGWSTTALDSGFVRPQRIPSAPFTNR